jgi:hypothetical protein
VIAPLRARHRATFAVLAVALPAAFAWALASRDYQGKLSALPEAVARTHIAEIAHLYDPDAPFALLPGGERRIGPFIDGMDLDVRVSGSGAMEVGVGRIDGLRAISLAWLGEPRPDLLAYWSASAGTSSELPTDAVLLGSVGDQAREFKLPDVGATPGSIVLFSLARFEVVASVPLEP